MADWLEVQNINHDNLNVEGEGRRLKERRYFILCIKCHFGSC